MSGCDEKSNTEVEVMWTNQHGTGPLTDDRVETQVILQYMCQKYPKGNMSTADVNKEFDFHTIRNGQRINTQNFNDGKREAEYIRKDMGLHEPASYYNAYVRRDRNKGKINCTFVERARICPGEKIQVEKTRNGFIGHSLILNK